MTIKGLHDGLIQDLAENAYLFGLEGTKMLCEALDKQIPKKPIFHHFYEDENDYSYYTCANRCHEYCQVNRNENFCRYCGQKIDWSDEEQTKKR